MSSNAFLMWSWWPQSWKYPCNVFLALEIKISKIENSFTHICFEVRFGVVIVQVKN